MSGRCIRNIMNAGPIPGKPMRKPATRYLLFLIVIATVLLPACKRPERSFAFIVIADTHFKGNDSLDHHLGLFAAQVEDIRGMALPDSLNNGIPFVKGLVLVGDITQDGRQEEWSSFLKAFTETGESRLSIPVYEGFGNHDGNIDGPVRQGIRERNPGRPGLTAISGNGLHYAWKWEGIHFLQLNLYPSSEWDPECGWCHYFHASFREPEESLDFLSAYLADHIHSIEEPIVLFFHYGWDDFSRLWWTENEMNRFYEVIKDHHVLGIFTGHRHVVNHFSWHGLDIWAAGSPAKPQGEEEFLLVMVNEEKMTVIASSGNRWTHSWVKDLRKPSSAINIP
jgi:cytolysin (calcineurin-like family phosphatase)